MSVTPVFLGEKPDGVSPSRVKQFQTCPRQYQYVSVERLPEKKSKDAYRGTIFHSVLEILYRDAQSPTDRTVENAMLILRAIYPEMMSPDITAELGMSEADRQVFGAEIARLIRTYFTMEDPLAVNLVGTEKRLDLDMGGWGLRGIIDRFDRAPDGSLEIVDYKGLALDTPIATPMGWTTMGDLQPGDKVFGSNGEACLVTVKSEVHHRPCYEITFKDGSSIICDDEHYWQVEGVRARKNPTTQVLTANELYEKWNHGERPFTIVNALPLQLAVADLPIDPYLLGCWLGDGTTRQGLVTVNLLDRDHFVNQWSRNGEVVHDSTSPRDTEHGTAVLRPHNGQPLTTRLRELGLLGNKHIPSAYLRSSETQRLSLLQGLMDTDGYLHQKRLQAVFSNTNRDLVDGVYELVVSLGGSAYIFEVPPCQFTAHTAWQVIFTPHGFNPFRLERKGGNVRTATAYSGRRAITGITTVPSVPTQCIQVDSPDSLYLAGRQMVPTHNTGAAPRQRRWEHEAFAAMRVYAFLASKVMGETPSKLRLLYVKTGTVIERNVTPSTLSEAEEWVTTTWHQIEEAYAASNFPPRPKFPFPCDYCAFKEPCEADRYSAF